MSIEKDIKQKSFKSEFEKGVVNLIFTNNWMTAKLKAYLKPFEVTMQQYNVLRILRGQSPKPISTAEIRNRMLDKMSDVSRIVDRLEKKKLIKRKTCKTDRRLVDIVITTKGLELLIKIDLFNTQISNLLGNLTEVEVTTLNILLDKIRGIEETKE